MSAGQRTPTPGLLVIATGNRHKTGEFKQLLSKLELELRDLGDYPGLEGAEEDGDTYELNAVKRPCMLRASPANSPWRTIPGWKSMPSTAAPASTLRGWRQPTTSAWR